MEKRALGRSGLLVSVVGLGCNNFGMRCDEAQSRAVVDRAIDEGVDFFDTADIYGQGESERMLGKALGKRRADVMIATKFGGRFLTEPLTPGGASARSIHRSVEASLARLGTDYIDLYQLHFPDSVTPQEETLRTLNDLVHSGKVRYLGCSNFAAWQVADAAWIARTQNLTPYVSAQNLYNLIDRRIERELVGACRHFGLGILPYFPLASGFLTGKYRRGQEPAEDSRMAAMPQAAERTLNDQNFAVLERLEAFARERQHTVLELAVSWLLAQEDVSCVIAGATRPEQVAANVAAAQWRLSRDELEEIDRLTRR